MLAASPSPPSFRSSELASPENLHAEFLRQQELIAALLLTQQHLLAAREQAAAEAELLATQMQELSVTVAESTPPAPRSAGKQKRSLDDATAPAYDELLSSVDDDAIVYRGATASADAELERKLAVLKRIHAGLQGAPWADVPAALRLVTALVEDGRELAAGA